LLAAVGPAVVIGHSLGGVIALALAELAPADLRAVIDVDGNVALGDCTYSSQIAAYPEADFVAHGHAAVCDRLQAHADPIVRGYGARMRTASPAQLWRYSHDLVDASTPETSARRRAAVGVRYVYVAGEPRGRRRGRARCWQRPVSTSAPSRRPVTGRSSSTRRGSPRS
jgi:pimeloyl-ACP methyl ester carboxylesterase